MTDSKTVVEDLAVWLTAVWDEEERLAVKAGGDRWILDGGIHRESHPSDEVVDWVYDEADEHIAYHDPASVLARIAAGRSILARYQRARLRADDPSEDEAARYEWGVIASTYEEVLCELATALQDRPSFRSEWLVERQGVEQ